MFSIGARLRDERVRLGKNQTEFAALAGASKGAQVNWEKDVASPNAAALNAFAEAGADVLYVLTGRRQSELLKQSEQAFAEQMLRSLAAGLEAPDAEASRRKLSVDEVREAACEALHRIATNVEIPDETRQEADELLRRHFDDPEAGRRRSARFASYLARRYQAERDLDDAFEGFEIVLPSGIRDQLVTLVLDHGIKTEELMPLLSEMARILPRRTTQQG